MAVAHDCPLCPETYEEQTDLRVHLEVEHRKSELVEHLMAHLDRRTDPTAERYESRSTV